MKKEELYPGKNLVKILIGNGYETAYIVKVKDVDNEHISIQGDHVIYDLITGRSITSYAPGYFARLVFLDEDD